MPFGRAPRAKACVGSQQPATFAAVRPFCFHEIDKTCHITAPPGVLLSGSLSGKVLDRSESNRESLSAAFWQCFQEPLQILLGNFGDGLQQLVFSLLLGVVC